VGPDPALCAAVRDVLRAAHEPVGTAEIAERLPTRFAGTPRRVLGDAARALVDGLAVRRGRYVYIPAAISGASVPLEGPIRDEAGDLRLPVEALMLLWPGLGERAPARPLRPAEVRLPDGRREVWRAPAGGAATSVLLSAWLGADQDGHGPDAAAAGSSLVLRCLDGEAGRYELAPASPREPDVIAARDAELIVGAAAVLRPGERYEPDIAALLLLASGIYHRDIPPTPLRRLASRPPFLTQWQGLVLRADLTPAMWRLFADRLEDDTWPWSTRPEQPRAYRLPSPVATGCRYRLRARLGNGWWAEFEACAEHTLTGLHLALQRAVDFDGDHLYAFFLSGRDGDQLTEVGCEEAEMRPPLTDHLTLGHFDPQAGQAFSYLFDFGDHVVFRFEVLERVPEATASEAGGATSPSTDGGRSRPVAAALPRLLASGGRRPRQYRNIDE